MSSDELSEKVVNAMLASTTVGILLQDTANRDLLKERDPQGLEALEKSGLIDLDGDIFAIKAIMEEGADALTPPLEFAVECLLPVGGGRAEAAILKENAQHLNRARRHHREFDAFLKSKAALPETSAAVAISSMVSNLPLRRRPRFLVVRRN